MMTRTTENDESTTPFPLVFPSTGCLFICTISGILLIKEKLFLFVLNNKQCWTAKQIQQKIVRLLSFGPTHELVKIIRNECIHID